jgi:type II secretory pathway pseudopilin PulG
MLAPRRGISVPAILATVVVVATVVGALYLLGPPSIQRQRRFDERRAQDLGRIAFAVDQHWRRTHALPATLDDLVSERQFPTLPRDPVTDSSYAYSTTEPGKYKLCATFQQPSDTDETPTLNYGNTARSWRHAAGATCFDLVP